VPSTTLDLPPSTTADRGFLAFVERLGNRLPEPWLLFVYGLVIVLILSKIAALQRWSIEAKMLDAGKVVTQTLVARDLLSADGLYWVLSQLIVNLLAFPPLGVVLVGMLAVGVAEKTGLIAALLKVMLRVTPRALITPAFVFVGAMSSLGSDAGYVVLPPIAAVMFLALGRSPIVGVAAVFAGIAGGFGANLAITGSDAILASLTTTAARFADTSYTVAATCNWYFSFVATFLVTLVGWAVTAWVVEPRFARRAPEEGGPHPSDASHLQHTLLTSAEKRGLVWSGIVFALAIVVAILITLIPGMPLHGTAQTPPLAGPPTGGFNPRWIVAIVPILFFVFILPGLAYGIATRQIRSDKDVGQIMSDSMAQLAPVIVLAFFAAQFLAAFNYSRLGVMLATVGGEWISTLALPKGVLLIIFILFVALLDLLISSMSAKYAFVSPVFVPMFMTGAGISPELTQAAYRLADSCTNVITPVNAYLIIILAVLRRYMPSAGLGTIIALMLPYCLAILVAWTALLQLWIWLDVPLGPAGPLHYLRLWPLPVSVGAAN
jgi:aminobenzoyl-glutamate transport protein